MKSLLFLCACIALLNFSVFYGSSGPRNDKDIGSENVEPRHDLSVENFAKFDAGSHSNTIASVKSVSAENEPESTPKLKTNNDPAPYVSADLDQSHARIAVRYR